MHRDVSKSANLYQQASERETTYFAKRTRSQRIYSGFGPPGHHPQCCWCFVAAVLLTFFWHYAVVGFVVDYWVYYGELLANENNSTCSGL